MTFTHYSKQQGQAMVLSLAFMAFALMTVLYSYNTSKINVEATKLQHTADNAAYSAATFVARDYNFKAYTNRAAVANQVAVAQLVGLSSWFNMTEEFADNACDTMCWIPYVGQVISAIRTGIGYANRGVQYFAEYAIRFEDLILNALSNSQKAMSVAGLAGSIRLPKDLVKANDSNADLDLMQNPLMALNQYHAWISFQQLNSRDDSQTRQEYNNHKAVIANSRDPFSKGRTYQLSSPFSGSILFFKWQTLKSGGSELISNGSNAETWTSMDTISFHFKYFRCKWSGCKWKGFYEIPLGWGATRSDSRANMNNVGNRNSWGSSRGKNPSASYYGARNQQERGAYSGVQPFYSLSRQANRRNTSDSMTIVASKPDNNLRTTTSINSTPKKLSFSNEKYFADRMSALSSAQAYYSRPEDLMRTVSAWARNDNKHEYANLYNPFWQARLVESSSTDRALVFAATSQL